MVDIPHEVEVIPLKFKRSDYDVDPRVAESPTASAKVAG